MDTILKRSTVFHPQTDGQKKLVNETLVKLVKGYNQHMNTWDENMIYIQHSYNRPVHISIGKSPYESFFAYLVPLPLDVFLCKSTRSDGRHHRKSIENI
jgi:hypothetical protein